MDSNILNETSPLKSALTFKKIFAKLKFSPALFEKIPLFVWCLKLKINEL